MNNKIKELINELEYIEKDLINDLNLIDPNSKDLQNEIINLSAKYPEHGDILKFILYINDIQNTARTNLENIYIDNFSELVKKKKQILSIMEEIIKKVKKQETPNNKDNSNFSWTKFFHSFFLRLTPNHIIWIGIISSLIMFMYFIIKHPDKSDKAFETITNTQKIITHKKDIK